MNMRDFNRKRYLDFWKDINRELGRKKSNREALLALAEQQFDSGFIQDDLTSVIHFRLHHPDDKCRIFTIQYNPKRAERYNGLGRKMPPPGSRSIHNGCFLCKENVRWQQGGVEVGYDIRTANAAYIAWMNPFPLMPVHTTIAGREHLPQSFIRENDNDTIARCEFILRDLIELASSLPGFIGFYNGVGAGASIPNHFHFHFFKRFEGSGPFSLERAAIKTIQGKTACPNGTVVKNYPIMAIYFHGEASSIIDASMVWVQKLIRPQRFKDALTANVIATIDPDEPDDKLVSLYIIPRNKYFSHAPGMIGMIGGLEILGEIVFSSAIEKQLLDTGQVDYHFVERILSSVEPLGLISDIV